MLLANAAKYSPSSSTIAVKTRHKRCRVVVSITDQGVGVTQDEQRHLGRRSFRSPRRQASVPGSGLGFWIASTFVRAHSGNADIASRGQGLGTTASIVLRHCRPPPWNWWRLTMSKSRNLVLLIDDEP